MRVDTSPKTAKSRRHPPALANDCALFLDVDGTLAEHVARPDDVTIDAELMRALPGVAVYLGHALALVTGRSIAGVDPTSASEATKLLLGNAVFRDARARATTLPAKTAPGASKAQGRRPPRSGRRRVPP